MVDIDCRLRLSKRVIGWLRFQLYKPEKVNCKYVAVSSDIIEY